MTVDDGGGEAASPRPVIGGAFGLLPEHPSISWHEPTAVDPTRAPEGRAVVRLQVLDVPHSPSGDAAGTRYGTDGWDAATAEGFADRVLAEAELHVPGLAVRVVLVGGALQ
jgi:phytoene dehydrogenase-like protein